LPLEVLTCIVAVAEHVPEIASRDVRRMMFHHMSFDPLDFLISEVLLLMAIVLWVIRHRGHRNGLGHAVSQLCSS
jgi:hypothetical protein